MQLQGDLSQVALLLPLRHLSLMDSKQKQQEALVVAPHLGRLPLLVESCLIPLTLKIRLGIVGIQSGISPSLVGDYSLG